MTLSHISATYVDGVLKPDVDLSIADNARVKLTIESIDPPADSAASWEALKALMQKRTLHLAGKKLTRDEMHERH